jgi:glycerol uptake facilitator-like aquaporin
VKKSDILAGALAFVLVAAFIGSIVMLSWREIPKSNEQLLTYMLGQLSGFVAAAVGVYFARRPESSPTGTVDDPLSVAGPKSTSDAPPVITEPKHEEPDPRP